MTEKIEPALSAKEFATLGPNGVGHPIMPSSLGDLDGLGVEDLPKAIAIANHLLPDSDPRKITREWVRAIRNAVTALPERRDDTEWITSAQVQATSEVHRAVLDLIADALESFLPPE